MKKIVTLWLLVCGVFTVNAQQQHTLYYKNGKKALEGKWTYTVPMSISFNDLMATFTRLESNGAPNIPDDVRLSGQQPEMGFMFDGPMQAWYPDGQLLRKCNYKNGTMDGLYETYYASGKIYCKGLYHSGMPDGEWNYYYADGKPKMQTHYKAYTQKQLDELIRGERFRNYRELQQSRLPTDKRLSIIVQTLLAYFSGSIGRMQRNTSYSGQQLFFIKDGEKEAELNYKNGARHGKWIRYDEGKKLVEAVFEMDSLVALYDRYGKDVLSQPNFNDQSDVGKLFQTFRQRKDYEMPTGGNETDPTGGVGPKTAGNDLPDIGERPQVFTSVEQMPEFPGDIRAWIMKNMIYPEKERKNGDEERIYVRFVVRKDGTVDNVEVIRGMNEAFKKEAIRLVKAMPKWKPGKQNGTPVNVFFNLPVIFKLE